MTTVPMFNVVRCKRIVRVSFFFLCAVLQTYGYAQQSAVRVVARRLNNYLLVVPVMINGSGPFQFVLDTGSSTTVVTRDLFHRLRLTATGQQQMSGIMPQASECKATLEDLSLSSVSVKNLSVVAMILDFPGTGQDVDGILGENFLDRFDVELDNVHNTVWLDQGTELENKLGGVRVPLSTTSNIGRETILHRPIVDLLIPSFSRDPILIVLDSGAQGLTLFPRTLGHLAPRFPEQSYPSSITVLGGSLKCARWIGDVRWEHLLLGRKDVVVCSRPMGKPLDATGNIGSSLFRSVFFAHREKYVIFNPDRFP